MSVLTPPLRATVAVPGWAKNELWRKARAVPSLDLRFADSKSLVDATTGQNLITFTRASSGTFVGSNGLIQTAANDVPRFDHNPTTGESLGLLVEEQRTNLVLRSEEFETTWSAGNVTVTSNNIAAPNGTVTAEKITDSVDVSNNAHQLTQGVAVLSGVAYTVSAFIKAGNGVGFSLGAGSVGAFATEQRVLFDASTGVATSQLGTPTNITMTAVGDGWYRCSCSITPTSSATATIVVRLYNSAASGFYIGDGTQFAYVWGAQLEAGAFPTSYIPTTTATVTRSADVCSISGSNFSAWFNATQSTIYSEAASSTGAAYTGYVYTIGASFNDSITHYRQSDSQPVARIRTASADEYGATGNGAIWTGTSVNRFALGVSTTSGRQSSNGTLSAGADDTSITFPAMSSMTIGALVGGSLALNGHLRRLTYWPTRLPNSTLQAVTQ